MTGLEKLGSMLKKRGVKHEVLNAKFHEKEAPIVAQAGRTGAVTIATNMAGRGTDIKLGEGVVHLERSLVESDKALEDICDGKKLRTLLEERPCGLHVIGSERHEARRIDRQLRGRCARQGDPGSYEAILSLEDELVGLYFGDGIKNLLSAIGRKNRPVPRWVSRVLIEMPQRMLERYHRRVRRELLKVDDQRGKLLAFTGAPE